jgi:hypothetical protein
MVTRSAFVLTALLSWILMSIDSHAETALPACPTDPKAFWTDCIGTVILPGGDQYVGEYRNNKRNGQGAFIYANGERHGGQWQDDRLINGRGTFVLADGAKYVGEFLNGAPHGLGTYTRVDGAKYVGELREGRFNGQGTLSWPEGARFVGDFLGGEPSGRGTFTERDGSKYVGEVRAGRYNGQGTLTASDGSKYVGDFSAGKFNGRGTLTYPNGQVYVGEFRDGIRTGLGEYRFPDRTEYVGEFVGGKYHGQGTYTRPDGTRYVGEFRDGLYDGQGTLTFVNGERHTGRYRAGRYEGTGSFSFADGRQYEGEFRDGLKSGEGTLVFPDGRRYVGAFALDQFNGGGSLTFPDGTRYVGTFKDGNYDGDGSATLPNGERYAGGYRAGKPHGIGTYYFPDGAQYVGEFSAGKYSGQGTYTGADGSRLVGGWVNGLANGPGIALDSQGNLQKSGIWVDGQLTRTDRSLSERDSVALTALLERARASKPASVMARPPISSLPSGSVTTGAAPATTSSAVSVPSSVLSSTVPAAPPAQRFALVIGNGAYANVPKLRNARPDAQAIAVALKKSGFDVFLKLDLDDRGLRQAIRDWIKALPGGSEAVFYFAGHGVQIGAANYLLPTNIIGESEEQVRDEGLALQRVLDDLSAQRVRLSVAIIDACRDNPFARRSGRSIGVGRGLAPTVAATGQMILFSAGSGQTALDNLGPKDTHPNGVFTRVLLKQMAVPGVPVDQVLKRTRVEVVQLAAGIGHEQVPALYDQTVGDFYFLGN